MSCVQRSDGYMLMKDKMPANRSDEHMVMKDKMPADRSAGYTVKDKLSWRSFPTSSEFV